MKRQNKRRRANSNPTWEFIRSLEKLYFTSDQIQKELRKRNRKLKRAEAKAKAPKKPKPVYKSYRSYLNSKWWKMKRDHKLRSTGWRCELCDNTAHQVHHLHYRTLGREKNTDLQSVCGTCHMDIHGIE